MNSEQGLTNDDLRSKEKNQKSKIKNPCSQIIPVLAYDLNNIKFEYAAPFFEKEEKTEYSYMLEGFDEKWSVWSTDWKTKYTNLDPGEYRFLVKAKNMYAHESEVGVYVFEIEPPFYRTWWFYISEAGLYLLLFGAVFPVKRMNTKYGIALTRFNTTTGLFVVFEYLQYFAEAVLSSKILWLVAAKVGMSAVFGVIQRPVEKVYFRIVGLLREKELTEKKAMVGTFRVGLKGDLMQAEKRGRKLGKFEGKLERNKEIVGRMQAKNFSIEQILECTGLTKEEYERMR